MVNGTRLRRLVRSHQRRKARYRGRRTAQSTKKSTVRQFGQQEVSAKQKRYLTQISVCGIIFVMLVTLKLIVPGNLAEFRGTLGQWLVHDADFAEAFSAVGRAISGAQSLSDSLDEAYLSVFGRKEAQEVMGESGKEILDMPQELPENVAVEQKILGFAYSSPLAGTVTSDFGWREDPNTEEEAFHYGLDIAAEEGSEIACFAEGIVGAVGESTELGKYLTVLHEGGFSTLYAHCKSIAVTSGEAVKMGEKVAEVGATGNATGAHLHFEVHEGETYLNPIYYVTG